MGVFPDLDYESKEFFIKPKSRILFYTDGITDSILTDNEIYGEKRLINKLKDCINLSIENCIKEIISDVLTKRNIQESDDIAILFIERN
ncbi:MAG: hypothetical protein KatS3mg129_1551 [Leptospiraceae bacterium]|nr:MAG: hypothetical protein KatS3mg129_1551 [Leptospiraceae bacterium]